METTGRYYSNGWGQRNDVPHGYGMPFDIYIFCQDSRIVVSYGDGAGERLDILKGAVRDAMPADEIERILERIRQ